MGNIGKRKNEMKAAEFDIMPYITFIHWHTIPIYKTRLLSAIFAIQIESHISRCNKQIQYPIGGVGLE